MNLSDALGKSYPLDFKQVAKFRSVEDLADSLENHGATEEEIERAVRQRLHELLYED